MTENRRRSWLLVPAFPRDEIENAANSGADAIVLDLVEFVPESKKASARTHLRDAIETAKAGGASVYVQTDPQSADADAALAVWPGSSGIVLSRAEAPQQIEALTATLDRLEKERGLAPGSLQIVVGVETAVGNHAAYEIASASTRVSAITLGRADLVMDLRPEPSGEIHLMEYLMQRIIIIAGAAGVNAIGAWWRAPDRGLLATPQRTYAAARRGRAIGFSGAMCLRANQVDALNRAYG
jgi:citrate lyase subunit beta/citryl-CoA lyase